MGRRELELEEEGWRREAGAGLECSWARRRGGNPVELDKPLEKSLEFEKGSPRGVSMVWGCSE